MNNHHRDHLRTAKRSILREENWPEHSSRLLARRLAQSASTPSERVAAREQAQHIQEAIAQLPDDDRELLVLRYVEDLSNQEVARPTSSRSRPCC
ncbi:MAG: RNA polymerase sigma factor [Bdellovibrionales bacterium]